MKVFAWTILFVAAVAGVARAQDYTTPQEVFDAMRQSFQPDKSQGLYVRYQFDLTGPNGGEWRIEVDDGKCKVERGRFDNPNVTFVASDKDWVALSNGKLSGIWAVFTGRLKVQGDQNLARKLDEMFP
jgi:putative sterol carrier protein